LVQLLARLPQLVHVPPPPPHEPTVTGWTQEVPLQQTAVHEIESQMQCPLEQRWPEPQDAPPPQWQAPPAQLSDLS
jgi:hypothetical protein